MNSTTLTFNDDLDFERHKINFIFFLLLAWETMVFLRGFIECHTMIEIYSL